MRVFCFSTLLVQQYIQTFFALKLETKNEGILVRFAWFMASSGCKDGSHLGQNNYA